MRENENKCGQIWLEFIFLLLFFLLTRTGYLIAPTKASTDKNLLSRAFDDDKMLTSNRSAASTTDFSSNSINDDYLMEPNINKTFFRSLNNSIIVSQVGSIVQIPCRVHLIGDEMVKLFALVRLIALIISSLSFISLHCVTKDFMDSKKRLSFAYCWTHNLQQRREI